MNYNPHHAHVVAELTARWPENRVAPSLGRIQALCDLMGNPHDAAPVIQITGTNGKGSTAIMIEAIVRAMGLRTGRFSSPHLVNVTERIAIDGLPISDDAFDELWEYIKPLVEVVDQAAIDGIQMTFFEIITGMAYAAFADAPVDVMIMEVGMGGMWDATSVATPAVSVVGPIDLDHTAILGPDIEHIAREKSGVIKEGSTAVLAAQQPEAVAILMNRCAEMGAPMLREGIDFGLLDRRGAVGGQLITVNTPYGEISDLYLPLYGQHMAHNAALAIASVHAMIGKAIEPSVIADGLERVVAPARLELVHGDPSIVLDTAHNPHGVRATLQAFNEAFGFESTIGVVAMMRDKAVDEVMELLSEAIETLVVTTVSSTSRALSTDELSEIAQDRFGDDRVLVAADSVLAVEKAMQLADRKGPNSGVLVIGSVYLAGDVRDIFMGTNDEVNTD